MVRRAVSEFSLNSRTILPNSCNATGIVLQATSVRYLRPGTSKSQRLCFTSRRNTCRHAFRGAGPVTVAAQAPESSDPIRDWILTEGGASAIHRVSPVFGGCINSAAKYETDAGAFFVKTNSAHGSAAMFEAEAKGLEAMHAVGAIKVPRPLKAGPLPQRGGFIIMEFVDIGSMRSQADLGRQLALLHRDSTSSQGFGFHCDNTIGSTPQPNPWTDQWVPFFRDHRLAFQLDLISKAYRDTELVKAGNKLLDKLPALFEGVEVRPSLLHGDLWSGNIAADLSGKPVILDPATYYGHSEAEFGMSWCASFGQAFYNAYFDVMPKQPGFEDRVQLYKLYHYLNHYNLFGSSYRGSAMSIIQRFI